jgi:hypothetical protein
VPPCRKIVKTLHEMPESQRSAPLSSAEHLHDGLDLRPSARVAGRRETATSGGPVRGVRDRTLPYRLERRRAHPDHRRVCPQLVLDDLAFTRKEVEANQPVIEQPEVSLGWGIAHYCATLSVLSGDRQVKSKEFDKFGQPGN